jgi:uncharacterized protein
MAWREVALKLNIANNLELPSDVVTQTFAVLAIRRVGKTYTASVLAEEMIKAGLPFIALDPTGAWWGLRASADGKREGFPVVIIGGAHGDVPLEPTAGKVLADLVVDHPGWYVLDLSQTNSNAEQDRIACDFAEQLYRRKAKNTFPLHLFVDEADSFAPQQALPNQKRMLGAFEALVRRGGIRGIGTTLITQRPAVLNKNVLTQADNLIVLRVTSPQDRSAIDDWVKGNGTKEQRDVMMGGLAALGQGEAWIWSPGTLGIFQKVRIRERETFNSSATPKPGEHRIEPQKLAPVDLDKLRDKIAATIEKAKADDPKELRAEIARLKRQLAEKGTAEPQVDRAAIDRAVAETERRLRAAHFENEAKYQKVIGDLQERLRNIAALAGDAAPLFTVGISARPVIERPQSKASAHKVPPSEKKRSISAHKSGPSAHMDGGQPLPKGERAILVTLAMYGEGRTAVQVALITGYAHNGGGFRNYLGALRSKGWIAGDSSRLTITDEGLAALGDFEPLPCGRDLINHWLRNLGKCERAILQALTEAYPREMSVEDLAQATGYEAGGGGFRNALGRLRTLELISGRGTLRASDVFFE